MLIVTEVQPKHLGFLPVSELVGQSKVFTFILFFFQSAITGCANKITVLVPCRHSNQKYTLNQQERLFMQNQSKTLSQHLILSQRVTFYILLLEEKGPPSKGSWGYFALHQKGGSEKFVLRCLCTCRNPVLDSTHIVLQFDLKVKHYNLGNFKTQQMVEKLQNSPTSENVDFVN